MWFADLVLTIVGLVCNEILDTILHDWTWSSQTPTLLLGLVYTTPNGNTSTAYPASSLPVLPMSPWCTPLLQSTLTMLFCTGSPVPQWLFHSWKQLLCAVWGDELDCHLGKGHLSFSSLCGSWSSSTAKLDSDYSRTVVFLFSLHTWVCSTFVALLIPVVTLSPPALQIVQAALPNVSHTPTYIYGCCSRCSLFIQCILLLKFKALEWIPDWFI